MKQGLVKLFGGQFLADLAHRFESGAYGVSWATRYEKVKGKKRLIGYILYALGYLAAAIATSNVCNGQADAPGCEIPILLSQGVTWAGWALMQLGILDHSARRRPEGVPRELAGVAGNSALVLGLVWGTAIVAEQLGVPREVCRVFVDDVATLTLVQIGLLAPGTAAGVATPTPRPVFGRGPR